MLKKVAHIVLAVLLLFSTLGVTIYKHYCGSMFVKTSISVLPKDCCKSPCKCCHNETHQLKITDSFETTTINFDFKNEIAKIFHSADFVAALLFTLLQSDSNTLTYKIQTCQFPRSTEENSTAYLQVFRL